MGDHFVLLVDRLITESTLEAVIESRNRSIQSTILAVEKPKNDDVSSSPRKSVECKICHDDDDYSNMESPCSCSGSLKYAHRRCVQRWCNEKGNTMCEICHQQFKPGYTVPQLFRLGQIPMHFRGNWEISRRDANSPRIIAMVSTEFNNNSNDTESDNNNVNSVSNSRSLTCCRSLAIIFMFLLIMRHTLPLVVNGHKNDFSFSLLMLLFLRTIGIVMPIYIMVKAITSIHQRRHRNQQVLPISSPNTETEQT